MNRKFTSAFAAIAAVLCLSSAAFAQSADELIAKNLEAKGGLDKLKAIQTMRSTGTMTAQGQSVGVTFYSKRPNMTRQEIVMGTQTMLMVFDGVTARMVNPMLGPTPMDIPGEQVEMIKDQSDIDGPLVDYKAKGSVVDLVGTEMVDGKKMFHLRVTRKSLPIQDVYLDGTTYLETKVSTAVPGSGVFETQFSDYRTVSGTTMPFLVKTVAAGMTLNETKIEKIEINLKLDDALFRIK